MAIDIQKLFADIIPDTAKQDAEQGANLASAYKGTSPLGSIGATDALLAPARNRRMRGAASAIAQPLFGVSFDTPAEKLQKTLAGIDMSTQEGEDAAVQALADAGFGPQSLQLRVANQEQRRAQQAQEADTLRSEAANRAVDADLERTDVMRDQNATANERLAHDVLVHEFNEKDQGRYRTIQERMNELEELRLELMSNDQTNQDKKYMLEAYEAEQAQNALGAVAIGLASQWESYKPPSGFRGSTYESWKNFMGSQDEISMLRRNTTRLINTLGLAGLPKGSASDRDVELVMSGFPDSTWDAEQLASWHRGAAKVAFMEADRLERKTQWLSDHNGSIAGFSADYRRVGQEAGYIEGLEDKYNVDFLAEGEEYVSDEPVKTLDDLIADDEAALAAKQSNPNNRARQNQRRSAQFR